MKPLHSLERKILSSLIKSGGGSLVDIASRAGIEIDQARRAIEWLKSKKMIKTETEIRNVIDLFEKKKGYTTYKLPERQLINMLRKHGGKLQVKELNKLLGMSGQELSAALGHAKSKNWINGIDVKGMVSIKSIDSDDLLPEEIVLKKLKSGRLFFEDLPHEEKKAVNNLLKRPNYLTKKPLKSINIELTEIGKKSSQLVIQTSGVDKLTPELIISGRWKKEKLRPIDVESKVPLIYPGKKHPVQRLIDEVRKAFLALGFEEIIGPLIQPAFWNFDALFVPQDHPAREMQDTFYLHKIIDRSVKNKGIVRRVSQVHLNGGNTGSKGWGYTWDLQEARRTLLRTHTTAVTVKYLADTKASDAKVFSIDKVFRNEKLDSTHLAELHQIEGIIVGKDVNLRDLMGVLTEFYNILGLKKVKFWPTYFPYTEPSMQSIVYVKDFGWMELCGMGIFRPEVTLPLGVNNPVLAWGGGLERLLMASLGIEDIRRLYDNNLGWLRSLKICQ